MPAESSFFATTFGAYGTTSLVAERLTASLPPVRIVKGEIDLDFGALLMHRHLIVDKRTIERTKDVSLKEFGKLNKSIDILRMEGFIIEVDYGQIFDNVKNDISIAVEIQMREPTKWLTELRFNNQLWSETQPRISEALGKHYDPLTIGTPYGILCALKQLGEPINEKRVSQIKKLIKSRKRRWTDGEKELLRSVIRPYLEEMYFNIALRNRLESPFLEWEAHSKFYETFYKSQLEKRAEPVRVQQEVAKVEELFSLALPNLRPETAAHLLRLLKDEKLKHFRERIREAVECGEKLDKDFGLRALERAEAANIDYIDSSWYGIMASRASVIVPWVPAIITQGVQEVINHVATGKAKSERKNYSWVYCLVKAADKEKRAKSVNKILDLS
jgi:hypothetical protein